MLNRCYIKLSLVNLLEMVFVLTEILFKIYIFKRGVLIYAEHCIYENRNQQVTMLLQFAHGIAAQN